MVAAAGQRAGQPDQPGGLVRAGLQAQGLRTQRTQEVAALTLKQGASSGEAATQIATVTAIQGSRGLGKVAPVAQHAKKRMMLYVGGGLLAGLALRLGIVVIRALISDKLRRRDEIASALGVPVKLSAGRCG